MVSLRPAELSLSLETIQVKVPGRTEYWVSDQLVAGLLLLSLEAMAQCNWL